MSLTSILLVEIPFALVVIVIFIIYYVSKLRYEALRKKGIKAEGKVVDLRSTGSRYNTCRAIVEFTDNNGQTYKVESRIGHGSWRRKKGATISVLYDPQYPAGARFKEDLDLLKTTIRKLIIVAVIIGGVIFVVGRMN